MEEGWERTPRLQLSKQDVQRLVEPAFPGADVTDHAVITAGLANTNIRFRVRGQSTDHVLRIHTRDPASALRERELMAYLASSPGQPIPTPRLLFSNLHPGEGEPPYSIWEFVEGTLLQDLFRTASNADLIDIASACGTALAPLAAHPFPKCGAFGPRLEIVEEYGAPSEFVPQFTRQALFGGVAGSRLDESLRDALWRVVEASSPLLSVLDGHYTLVHADYKRSNLVMTRYSGSWRVAAILDWEFACAGSPMMDVGIFLRAGESLPSGFRQAFADAYHDAGGPMPENWLALSRLLDVISQLSFLSRPVYQPRVVAESIAVLRETVTLLR